MKITAVKSTSTMADIAATAGVSLMTVHRALSGNPDISADTKKKILGIASEMNYRPNAIARAMRSRKFGSIGLAMGPADVEIAVIVGISRMLNEEDYNLVFAEIPYGRNDCSDLPVPRLFRENLVDGLIMHAGVESHSGLPAWLNLPNHPTVSIMGDGKMNSAIPDYCLFLPKAFEHVLHAGYGELIFVGPVKAPPYHYSSIPYKVFKSWATRTRTPHSFISTDIDKPAKVWESELVCQLKSKRKRAAAFVAPSFVEARRCHAAALELGMRIPGDFGIMLFSTRDETTDSGKVFSGWKYSSFEMGEAAAKLLLERIRNKGADLPSAKIKFNQIKGETL